MIVERVIAQALVVQRNTSGAAGLTISYDAILLALE
jgi:hypothetical protein